jgi:plasmid maintenance system antidote protein VapI
MNLNLKFKIIERYGCQADFAVAVSAHESEVSRVVHGRRQLPDELKLKWAKALNCPQEHLFNYEGVNSRGPNGRAG